MIETAQQAIDWFTTNRSDYKTDEEFVKMVDMGFPEYFEDVMEAFGLAENEWALKRILARKKNNPTGHFYLVTEGNSSNELDEWNWKWGITTKDHFRKRSSDYSDCHRWLEIPSMRVGRKIERLVALLTNGVRGGMGCWNERAESDFPLEVLASLVDWAIANVDKRGDYSQEAKIVKALCMDCPNSEQFTLDERWESYGEMVPAVICKHRAMYVATKELAERKELVAMW